VEHQRNPFQKKDASRGWAGGGNYVCHSPAKSRGQSFVGAQVESVGFGLTARPLAFAIAFTIAFAIAFAIAFTIA